MNPFPAELKFFARLSAPAQREWVLQISRANLYLPKGVWRALRRKCCRVATGLYSHWLSGQVTPLLWIHYPTRYTLRELTDQLSEPPGIPSTRIKRPTIRWIASTTAYIPNNRPYYPQCNIQLPKRAIKRRSSLTLRTHRVLLTLHSIASGYIKQGALIQFCL